MAELNEIVAWTAADIAALRYEQARESLDAVVTALEDADVPLEDLMKLWEVGERLAAACEAHLTRAKERLGSSDAVTG
jgi:exodeoxyribonuclease VII small subunit